MRELEVKTSPNFDFYYLKDNDAAVQDDFEVVYYVPFLENQKSHALN